MTDQQTVIAEGTTVEASGLLGREHEVHKVQGTYMRYDPSDSTHLVQVERRLDGEESTFALMSPPRTQYWFRTAQPVDTGPKVGDRVVATGLANASGHRSEIARAVGVLLRINSMHDMGDQDHWLVDVERWTSLPDGNQDTGERVFIGSVEPYVEDGPAEGAPVQVLGSQRSGEMTAEEARREIARLNDLLLEVEKTSGVKADEHDWCSDYETAMEKAGLEPRRGEVAKDYEFTLEAEVEWTVSGQSALDTALSEIGFSAPDTTGDQVLTFTTEVTVTRSSTAPDDEEFDDEDFIDNLPVSHGNFTVNSDVTVEDYEEA